jgi:hypothetical protein
MTLYERVLDVARTFLAGSTEQFMERQCRTHLGIAPEALNTWLNWHGGRKSPLPC